MLVQTKVYGKMYPLGSTLDSSSFSLVCSVYWILSLLSFLFKSIAYHYYLNYAKIGKIKILPLTTPSALDSFFIYVVIPFPALVQT